MANPVLITVHGDGSTTSLNPRIRAESHGVFRLRRLIEPPLAARACLLHTQESLDRVEALISYRPNQPVDIDHTCHAHCEFVQALLTPAASEWDLLTLRPLWWEFSQQLRGAIRLLPQEPLLFEPGHVEDTVHRPLVDAYRTGNPDVAVAATLRHISQYENIAMTLLADADTATPSMGAGA